MVIDQWPFVDREITGNIRVDYSHGYTEREGYLGTLEFAKVGRIELVEVFKKHQGKYLNLVIESK